jgi:hypothetical protein
MPIFSSIGMLEPDFVVSAKTTVALNAIAASSALTFASTDDYFDIFRFSDDNFIDPGIKPGNPF